jgi:hypothetical protein
MQPDVEVLKYTLAADISEEMDVGNLWTFHQYQRLLIAIADLCTALDRAVVHGEADEPLEILLKLKELVGDSIAYRKNLLFAVIFELGVHQLVDNYGGQFEDFVMTMPFEWISLE